MRMWVVDSHVRTKLIEVPVAILLHFLWREDGQGPVGVHGDHHAANVRLPGEKRKTVNPCGILSILHRLTGALVSTTCLPICPFRC